MINKEPELFVKIADTPETQAKGLMFVKKMPKDTGMLFVFGMSQKLSFWGENTYIPLDIAFVNKHGIITDISIIEPLSRKAVKSSQECKYAVEANLGFFKENGVRVGDKIHISKDDKDEIAKLKFVKKTVQASARNKIAQEVTDDIVKKYPTLEEYYRYYDEKKAKKDKQKQDESLPVLTQDELGQYLEDNIEEQRERQEQEGIEPTVPPTVEELEPKSVDQLEQEIPRFSNMSDAFNWGLENQQIMKISYQTTIKRRRKSIVGNNLITRYIEPHGRYTSRPENDVSHQVLVTYDETAGGIRAFRLQNVKEFSFVGRKFRPKFIVR